MDVDHHLSPKNILLHSIARNIVTERLKRGLEIKPLKAFFLKTILTTTSENFRICLVLRNSASIGIGPKTANHLRQQITFTNDGKCEKTYGFWASLGIYRDLAFFLV